MVRRHGWIRGRAPLGVLARPVLLAVLAVLASPGSARAAESVATPAGPELILVNADQVLDAVRKPGASATLVNVWATWCVPCREEFPDLMKVYREFEPAGLRLVLVSADFDDDREAVVKKFLKEYGVTFTTYLKDQPDEAFIEGLEPRWSGALPVSLFYDANGALKDVQEGSATYKRLKKKTKSVLGSKTREREAR